MEIRISEMKTDEKKLLGFLYLSISYISPPNYPGIWRTIVNGNSYQKLFSGIKYLIW